MGLKSLNYLSRGNAWRVMHGQPHSFGEECSSGLMECMHDYWAPYV